MSHFTDCSILAELSSIGTFVVVAAVLAVLYFLVRSARSPQDAYIPKLGPSFFFWLGMTYLVSLLILAFLYQTNTANSQQVFKNELIGGMLPVAVPWFGALGAVMISLQGVFCYNDKWDVRQNYWHIARPVFGAVLGIMTFYFSVLLTSSAGTQLGFMSSPPKAVNQSELIIYYVLAFLSGYREETFRELIKRVTDKILQADETGSRPLTFIVNGILQHDIDFGDVKQATSATKTVEICNSSKTALMQTSLEITQGVFVGEAAAMAAVVDLTPGSKRTVVVTFTPTGAGPFSGSLTVKGTNLSPPQSIPLKGKGIE